MLIAALLLALTSEGTSLPTPTRDEVTSGIQQAREGLLDAAVATLDGAIARLAQDGAGSRGDLLAAHVHKGAALVALQREEAAKQAFRSALAIEPDLRLRRGDFPDRVVRVFDAARTGRSRSVMERPSAAPKKAGMGVAGIAAIVGGGVALAGGAVAVAAGGEAPGPAPTPMPSPTPDPASQMTPIPGTTFGPIRIEVVAISPPSGTVVTGCGVDTLRCGAVQVQYRVTSTTSLRGIQLFTSSRMADRRPCSGARSSLFDLRAGEPFVVGMILEGSSYCSTPATVTVLSADILGTAAASGQQWNVRFTFNP